VPIFINGAYPCKQSYAYGTNNGRLFTTSRCHCINNKMNAVFALLCIGTVAAGSSDEALETPSCLVAHAFPPARDATTLQQTTCISPPPSHATPICELNEWQDLSTDSKSQYIKMGWDEDEWDDSLQITGVDKLDEVLWNDICENYQAILTSQGYKEDSWNTRVHVLSGACQVVSWNDLSEESQEEYENEGWTESMWNNNRWIHSRHDAEDFLWKDLCSPYRQELQARGWTEQAWDTDDGTKMTFYNEAELSWEELSQDRQLQFIKDGFNKKNFHRMYRNTEDGSHNDILAPAGEFLPLVVSLDVPEVQSLNFTFLSSLNMDIGLVASLADKESESFVASAPLSEYIARIHGGDTSMYAQMEDSDRFTDQLWKPIGSKVMKHLRSALNTCELAQNGQYQQEWMHLSDNYFDWAMFLGGKGTTTAMHFDTDAFSFLYVVEGRKRVVMLENTGLVNETRFNVSSFFHGSAWTDMDILKTENQPEGTLVVEVGPGEGVAIPHRAWHSVENLEHTIAYAIRLM